MAALDGTSRRDLGRRQDRGERALELCWGSKPEGLDDRHAAGSDTISDVLTALLGPPGVYLYSTDQEGDAVAERPECKWNHRAIADAHALVERAFRSWCGDAEDYFAPRNTRSREEVGGGV